MDLKTIFLFLVAAINLGLGILVYSKNRRDWINISFALVTFWATIWVVSNAMFRLTGDLNLALIWSRIGYGSAALIPPFLVFFTYLFSVKIPIRFFQRFFLFVGPIFILYSIFTDSFVREIIIKDWEKEVVLGPFHYFYVLYYFVFMGWAIYNLFKKHTYASGVTKIQIKYILAGFFPAIFFGSVFNLIFPCLGNYKFIWLGPYFSLSVVIATTYAIIRHHLMNIRIIATELFTLAIILLFLTNTILAQSFQEFLMRAIFLLLVVILGLLLVRGTIREIEVLRKLNEAKSEFISIASHQLRTPLTAIKGYISMILEGTYGKLSKKAKVPVENIYKSNERLIKLVNNLLNISRIEVGRMEMELKKISIEDIISSVIGELEVEAKKKGLYLKWEEPLKPLPKILADGDKIRQVILNVVDNGIRYTDRGGVTINIKIQDSRFKIQDSSK